VALDGRLEWREWQDQQGNNRQSIEIIADAVQFLGGRDDAGGGGGGGFTPRSDVPVDDRDFQPAGAPSGGAVADDDTPFSAARASGRPRPPGPCPLPCDAGPPHMRRFPVAV
jgi:single-strand DNA-binding protein